MRRALDKVGLHGAEITRRVVDTHDEAVRLGFTGSPTFLVNGRDPFAEPERVAGLTCRVYRAADGRLSGVPELGRLCQALAASGV